MSNVIPAPELAPHYRHGNLPARLVSKRNQDGKGKTWHLVFPDGFSTLALAGTQVPGSTRSTIHHRANVSGSKRYAKSLGACRSRNPRK